MPAYTVYVNVKLECHHVLLANGSDTLNAWLNHG